MRTMKIMKRMMGLAAAILALSACSESEDLLSAFHSDPNAVRITAEVGKASANGFTRSNPLGDAEAQKKFKDGDMISVQADGQDAVTYQLNGEEWQPQGGKFLKWESNEMTFTAYYPATFDGNLDEVTLPAEYDEASLVANDFMSYSGKQTNTKDNNNKLSLTMERKMARVVVEIAGFNDQYAGATIDNVNSLSICGIKAYKHDNKFYALIKPCAAQSSATFISLDVAEGASKTTETLTGIPALTAGKSYTYKLTVGKDKVSVSGITVANWTTGTITDNGKTEECPTPYITFTAKGVQTFKMTTTGTYEIKGLEYSLSGGEWQNVEKDKEVIFGGTNGDLRLRGINPNGTTNGSTRYSTITFTDPTVNVACTGDIRTLLDWRIYNIVETNNARFCNLFNGCSVLTSAPELPATTLADYCYYQMFFGCTSLTSAPKLSATTLADYCYYKMFYGCTSLTSTPELPATTLEDYCYQSMFFGCTSLTSAPELPATTLEYGCYYEMFDGCTSLTSAPELPATTLVYSCYDSMFKGCTSLTSAPELPATTLAYGCYDSMFNGCTSLTSAPELPATTLVSYCYRDMFRSCTKLTSTPELPATTLEYGCYNGMFYGCTKLSTVTMLAPSDKIENTSSSFSFKNWLNAAGTSATTRKLIVLDEAAYNKLVDKKYLPAIWKKDQCTVENYTPKP